MMRLAAMLQNWLAVWRVSGQWLIWHCSDTLLPRHDPLAVPGALFLLLKTQLFLFSTFQLVVSASWPLRLFIDWSFRFHGDAGLWRACPGSVQRLFTHDLWSCYLPWVMTTATQPLVLLYWLCLRMLVEVRLSWEQVSLLHHVWGVAIIDNSRVVVYLPLLLPRQVPVVLWRGTRCSLASMHVGHVGILVQELWNLKVGRTIWILHQHSTEIQVRVVNTANSHMVVLLACIIFYRDQLLRRNLLPPVNTFDRVGADALNQLGLLFRIPARTRNLSATPCFWVHTAIQAALLPLVRTRRPNLTIGIIIYQALVQQTFLLWRADCRDGLSAHGGPLLCRAAYSQTHWLTEATTTAALVIRIDGLSLTSIRSASLSLALVRGPLAFLALLLLWWLLGWNFRML